MSTRSSQVSLVRGLIAGFGVLASCALAPPARAEWPTNPATNLSASDSLTYQSRPRCVADGKGGFYVSWYDERVSGWGLYLRHFDAQANSEGWPAGGIRLGADSPCAGCGGLSPCADGSVIATWYDRDDHRMHAQRVDEYGVARWALPSVTIGSYGVSTMSERSTIQLADDGPVFFYRTEDVAWNNRVWADRLLPNGQRAWPAPLLLRDVYADDTGDQQAIAVSDTECVVVWDDHRRDSSGLYAQRIGASGRVQWASGGVRIAPPAWNFDFVADGRGGLVGACTHEYADTGSFDVRLFAIDPAGRTRAGWPATGLPWASERGVDAGEIGVVPFGPDGRFMLIWYDEIEHATGDVFAQRFDTLGVPLWPGRGKRLFAHPTRGGRYDLKADGAGGAFLKWRTGSPRYDVYGQHVGMVGSLIWTAAGVPVCTAPGEQSDQLVITRSMEPDGKGGVIYFWEDKRLGSSRLGVYLQRVRSDGALGEDDKPTLVGVPGASTSGLSLGIPAPNPVRSELAISYSLSQPGPASLQLLDVMGRVVRELDSGWRWAGTHRVSAVLSRPGDRVLEPGVYWVRLLAQGEHLARQFVHVP